MLFNDYTSVLSWRACRDRHIVLTSILDGHLYLWAYCYSLESYPRPYESVIVVRIPRVIIITLRDKYHVRAIWPVRPCYTPLATRNRTANPAVQSTCHRDSIVIGIIYQSNSGTK
jgi:hypothetical protein